MKLIKNRLITVSFLLVLSLSLAGCGGKVLPREVYRVRDMLENYYHSLLRLHSYNARLFLLPGGESEQRFETVFREFQAFRARKVERYNRTETRIANFDIEVEEDTAHIAWFMVTYCDWNSDELDEEPKWTGTCVNCPGECGQLQYPSYNGTARRIDGRWYLE